MEMAMKNAQGTNEVILRATVLLAKTLQMEKTCEVQMVLSKNDEESLFGDI